MWCSKYVFIAIITIFNKKTRGASFPTQFLSRRWLVHARLGLSFPRPIAAAMGLCPALRPAAPVRCHHPGYWCNMQVLCILPGSLQDRIKQRLSVNERQVIYKDPRVPDERVRFRQDGGRAGGLARAGIDRCRGRGGRNPGQHLFNS